MTGLILLLLVGIFAHGWLLLAFFKDAWMSNSGLFTPVAILIALALVWRRRRDFFVRRIDEAKGSVLYDRSPCVNGALWIGGVSIAAAVLISHLLGTPLLGWLSFLMFLGLMAYAAFGNQGCWALVPVLVLLAFLKPIPDAFEPWVQLGLQNLSTQLASILLDFLRVYHYTEGVVIGLVGREGLASEVCGGIRSLVPSLFLAIAWGIYHRYHWFRTTLNVCQTLFWVVLFNAIRIGVLLWNYDRGGDWLDSYGVTSVVEYLALGCILFFAWSSDQLFASIVEPAVEILPPGVIDPGLEGIDTKPAVDFSSWLWTSVAIFGTIGLLTIRLHSLYQHDADRWSARQAAIELPVEIEGWKVSEVTRSDKPRNSFVFFPKYGSLHREWKLEREGRTMQLQSSGMMGHYPGPSWIWRWHGWNTDAATKAGGETGATDSRALKMLDLSRLPGESGALVGCGWDSNGYFIPRWSVFGTKEGLISSAMNALSFAVGGQGLDGAQRQSVRQPVGELSLHWKSARKLDATQKEEMHRVFESILSRVEALLTNRKQG